MSWRNMSTGVASKVFGQRFTFRTLWRGCLHRATRSKVFERNKLSGLCQRVGLLKRIKSAALVINQISSKSGLELIKSSGSAWAEHGYAVELKVRHVTLMLRDIPNVLHWALLLFTEIICTRFEESFWCACLRYWMPHRNLVTQSFLAKNVQWILQTGFVFRLADLLAIVVGRVRDSLVIRRRKDGCLSSWTQGQRIPQTLYSRRSSNPRIGVIIYLSLIMISVLSSFNLLVVSVLSSFKFWII